MRVYIWMVNGFFILKLFSAFMLFYFLFPLCRFRPTLYRLSGLELFSLTVRGLVIFSRARGNAKVYPDLLK